MTALSWLFRLSMAGTYIGHGAFGIITKQAWIPYIALWGIPEPAAWKLMPWIGAMDITLGVIALVSPRRLVMGHLVLWGTFTALLRPLTGEGWWEFLERAGNWGVALAFLLAVRPGRTLREWVEPVREIAPAPDSMRTIGLVLRATTALLLIGHGGLGAFTQKQMLIEHFSAVGVHAALVDPPSFLRAVGCFEIALGVAILLKPLPYLLALAFVWKVGTELLYPMSGAPIWEFIERAGSYAAPLGLIVCDLWARDRLYSPIESVAVSSVR